MTFNKPTLPYTYYAVATYTDRLYKGYSNEDLCGNHTNTIKHQLYNPETHILYVCLPIEKDSLNQYVTFEDTEEEILWIHNSSDSVIMVEIKSSKYYYPHYHTINRNHSLGVHNSKSSDITSFKTYLVPRYEGEIREELEKKKREKMEFWIMLLLMLGCSCTGVGYAIIFEGRDMKELFKAQTWKRIKKQDLLMSIGLILVGVILMVLGIILWI